MPTATFTYSQTGDFGYNAGQETKTVEWVISSSLPIQGGTFLDGTPWVVNNGDINLISTSPAPANVPIKVMRREAFDPALNGSPFAIYDFNVDINNTVINPDLGKYLANNSVVIVDTLVRADNTGVTTPFGYFNPWDGRAGMKVNEVQYDRVGKAYDSTQKWNRQPRRLNTGDLVAVAISHFSPITGQEQIVSGITAQYPSGMLVRGIFDGKRPGGDPLTPYQYTDSVTNTGIIDMFGCLTVVSSPPPPNSFRPPCNWDPLDRANAPIFQEVNDLEDLLMDYPNYSIDSNTKTWTTTAYQKYLSNPKYKNIDPILFYYINDQNGLWGCRETRLSCPDPFQEYGSVAAKVLETLLFTAHTTDSTSEVRAKIRRVMTQRGIDLYGGRISLGKYVETNGGHTTEKFIPETIAYLVTGSQQMYESMQCISRGNPQNGTFKLISDEPTYYRKLNTYNAIGQFTLFDPGTRAKDFISSCRWKNLTIKQILSGTSPTYGPYQVVRIKAPELLHAGKAFVEDPSRVATWNRDSLYNVSYFDIDGGQGRWNNSTNTAALNGNYFMGGYLKSGNNITRIIKAKAILKDAPIGLSISQYEAGYTGGEFTNDDLLVWTQTDIFTGNETTVDMSPNIQEELMEGVLSRHVTYEFRNTPYQYGYLAYAWNPSTFLPLWAYYKNCLEQKGLQVPFTLTKSYTLAKWYVRDYLTLWTYFFSLNSAYNEYDPWYLAMFRKLLANDPTQPMPVPWKGLNGVTANNICNSYFQGVLPNGTISGKRAAWTPLPQTMTWIDFFVPPPNITVVSGGGYQTNTNPVSFYREGESVTIGRLKPCQLKRNVEDPNKFIIEMKSSTQSEPRLPYSYVENKTLYVWVGGASKPIKMNKKSETQTTTSWTQIWEFPENKRYLPDFFANYTLNDMRLFFADEDPRFDEQLSFAEQLVRLLGSWGSDNPVYDLNEDGIVDSADLSILLSQWNASNNQRILVFASPAGDAHTYEEVAVDTYVKLEGTGRDGIYKVIGKYSDNKTFSNGLKYTILEFGPRLRSVKGANIVTVRPPIQQEAV